MLQIPKHSPSSLHNRRSCFAQRKSCFVQHKFCQIQNENSKISSFESILNRPLRAYEGWNPFWFHKFLAKATNTHKHRQLSAALLVYMKPVWSVQDLYPRKKFHNSMVSVLSYHWKTVCVRIKITAKSNYNTFFQHFSSLRLLQSSRKNKLISTIYLVITQWFTKPKVISQFGYTHEFS